jgi:hypothetical protein
LVGGAGSDAYYVDQAGDVSSPMIAQLLFGVGCRERSAAKRNEESRHLTPINDLRQFAHQFGLPACGVLGGWPSGHDALDAANDALCRWAA